MKLLCRYNDEDFVAETKLIENDVIVVEYRGNLIEIKDLQGFGEILAAGCVKNIGIHRLIKEINPFRDINNNEIPINSHIAGMDLYTVIVGHVVQMDFHKIGVDGIDGHWLTRKQAKNWTLIRP